ncbi:uncharacterized protein CLUP02_14684 [Colletotrichum lupini]|uniref:Uncharacterized protein n=1 Tax=Colletotrichum lupini TaxID=145971 RepID=A0A9Q8T6Q7_9PEZI|nr:uncharacterized protein CLUP02_14684 [Colletotrichum lupini]UQC89156.1 hypothetical protein CLUP02_14684 [Colletotrichum lupini]
MSVKDVYVRLMRSAFSSYPRRISRTKIGHDPPVHSIPSLRAERSYWLQKSKKSQLNDLYQSGYNQPNVEGFSDNEKLVAEAMLGVLKRTLADEVDRITRDRSFILTEYGYMGLAPLGAQVGDHVVVIGGCPVPLVLRKQGEAYQVIGDTYVCGLMEGQMSENVSAGTAHIEEFTLV